MSIFMYVSLCGPRASAKAIGLVWLKFHKPLLLGQIDARTTLLLY